MDINLAKIDAHGAANVQAVAAVLGKDPRDKCWPVFEILGRKGAAFLPKAIHLRQPQPVYSLEHLGPIYKMLFLNGNWRRDFLKAAKIAPKAKEAALFPTRESIAASKKAASRVYCSAEMSLWWTQGGEDRQLMLLRDEAAPAYPNCLTPPGGMLDVSPISNLFKECNEELTLFFCKDEKLYALFLSHEGVSGMSKEEKTERLGLALRRAEFYYDGIFRDCQPEQVEILDIPLTPYESMEQGNLTQVRIDYGNGLVYEAPHMVVHNETLRAISFERHFRLPAKIMEDDLVLGKNFFAVDSESIFFARKVLALTKAQLAYARNPNGQNFSLTPPKGALPPFGALISVGVLSSDVPQMKDVKPDDHVDIWVRGKGVRQATFAWHNYAEHNCPYVLKVG